ncbi:MAG: AMIN domain-containing protein [Leptolyngbyaceae bacterium]|nr:AMIN domain-containing protein [Leptolyngbyaceae bacterium]
MKHYFGLSTSMVVAAVLATQPAWAAATQVTAVRTNTTGNGVEVVLETESGDRPQIFTVNRGKSWVADMINTQLKLPQGGSFRQANPAPGIALVEVKALDANSIRVTVTGDAAAPVGQTARRTAGSIAFNISRSNADQVTSAPAPSPAPTAQAPVPPKRNVPIVRPTPDLAPPFLPRAVAPPVGDIAVANIDASPTVIDLGTAERVPRLVLRDAPVREVLALLARAAGLNVAYVEGGAAAPASPGAAAPTTGTATTTGGSTISLDIENEPVQDVFNYVLRLSGLQSNRSGRTIFVGKNLPLDAQGIIVRTLRLNQMKATLPETQLTSTSQSASTLTSAGAGGGATTNSSLGRTTTYSQNLPMKGALQTLVALGATSLDGGATTAATPAATTGTADKLLKGLQVSADARTNAITLIGPLNKVEIATAQLAQLDVRKRQVAVNVKIVEVNLANTDSFGASFSFGINESFFSVRQGQLGANFGLFNPNSVDTNSFTSPSTVANPFSTIQPTLDPNSPIIDATGRTVGFNPLSPLNENPLSPVVTGFTPGAAATGTTAATPPLLTYGLPPLFQFPNKLLVNLQARVTAGNAKILTDPTLIVQEGSQSQVNLTSQVFSGFTEQRRTEGNNVTTTSILPGAPIDVGVILNIAVDQIDDNGFVTLAVSPEVSSPGTSVTDPSRNNLLVQQLVNRRRLETGNVRLRDGQTLILTGVIQEQDRTVTTKTPILGDIPLIGSLFRNTSRDNSRTEVVVLVTPQVMDDSDRSSFGYNYTPSPSVRQILQQGNRSSN